MPCIIGNKRSLFTFKTFKNIYKSQSVTFTILVESSFEGLQGFVLLVKSTHPDITPKIVRKPLTF